MQISDGDVQSAESGETYFRERASIRGTDIVQSQLVDTI